MRLISFRGTWFFPTFVFTFRQNLKETSNCFQEQFSLISLGNIHWKIQSLIYFRFFLWTAVFFGEVKILNMHWWIISLYKNTSHALEFKNNQVFELYQNSSSHKYQRQNCSELKVVTFSCISLVIYLLLVSFFQNKHLVWSEDLSNDLFMHLTI